MSIAFKILPFRNTVELFDLNTSQMLDFMNECNRRWGAENDIFAGYGCSEYFGVITFDKYGSPIKNDGKKSVVDVGIPICGATIGIFDDDGKIDFIIGK